MYKQFNTQTRKIVRYVPIIALYIYNTHKHKQVSNSNWIGTCKSSAQLPTLFTGVIYRNN